MSPKIKCKDCKKTCCDDVKLALRGGVKGVDPNGAKVGDWLYVAGITWVKKKSGLWKCRAFDTKARLCKIYAYRPPLCRGFACKWGRRRKKKRALNATGGNGDPAYTITFLWNGVNDG